MQVSPMGEFPITVERGLFERKKKWLSARPTAKSKVKTILPIVEPLLRNNAAIPTFTRGKVPLCGRAGLV